jgi:hypothetical protein
MLGYLPEHIANSKVIQIVMGAYGPEFDTVYYDIADIKAQFNIDTATWGLDIYEKELKIAPNHSKSYEDRRAVVKSRWRGSGKVDSTLIKIVVDAFTNGQVEVGFIDGVITIKFNGSFGIPPTMQDVYNAVEEIKPAHLAVAYYYKYLLINEIHNVITINELQTKQLNLFAGGA